ncbi:MAG: multiprotein bridging factor aMBF1 [Candidatus Korarchaeum sp.]|nr:multiprotein bridging factor aMBF1 [Candidatus Korarchaeum sp.]MDW8036206.1 multiprotein bridging factor aMBF1 [Candidatus Korarchaeum sp.]
MNLSEEVYVCELCGGTFYGRPVLVDLEGYKASLCGRCARKVKSKKTGEKALEPQVREVPQVKQQKRVPREVSVPKRERKEAEVELVEDYGRRIREARESLGLSIEQVAASLNIKASLLRNIESERVVPSYELARGIEKLLEVSIIQRNPEKMQVVSSASQQVSYRSVTLGEIVEVKDKRRKREDAD